MRIYITLSLLSFCLWMAPAVLAQQESSAMPEPPPARSVLGPVQFERMEAEGFSIVQDRQGFMWFGGPGGLYRYDGYGYTHYQHEPQDATSLSFNWVESLFVDSGGTLWVGTFGGGLNRYDPEKNAFTHFRRDPTDPGSLSQDTVRAILEDQQGTLWIGTHGGLNRFEREAGTFTHYRHDPDDATSLSNDQVRVLYEDRQGTLWVGTGSGALSETPADKGGLNRFDPATGTFTRYLHQTQDETSLIHNKVMSLYEDSRGTFWVGTLGDGLHTMDREQGTFTRYRYDPKDPKKLSRPFLVGAPPVEEGCEGWECGGVSFIHEDKSGALWIGGFNGGIYRYDPATGVRTHHEAATTGLDDNDIWRLYESHDGTLWVGTWSGLYKAVASPNLFAHYAPEPGNPGGLGGSFVTALHEARDGTLWIGTWGGGVDRFDRTTGLFTHYRHEPKDPESLGSDGVFSLYEDREGVLWIGGEGVLSRYDRATDRFTHYRHEPKDPESLSPGWVFGLLEDHEGRFWVGSFGGGLSRLDRATGRFTHYRNRRHRDEDPQSLSNNAVLALYEDREGALWIGTGNGGLSRFDAERETFTTYLSGRGITSLHEDSRGTFWVGTGNDGLHRFDRSTGTSTRYGRLQGLPYDWVMGLVEDEEGYLWISTSEGVFPSGLRSGRLSRLDPRTGTFVSFDSRDGLPEIGFFKGSVLRSRDGTLFFGGNGGLTAFDPSMLSKAAYQGPKVALTGLRIFNEEVMPGAEGPLRQAIHRAREIRLSYDENDFTFDYTGLSFRDPEETQYEYMLEGHDAGWVSARAQRSARYSGLAPGRYVFRVRAADSRGIMSQEVATIQVVVLPPWWRTIWAYLFYGLLFMAGVFAVDRVQRRRLIRKERERARERELVQAREIERAEREAEKLRAEAAEAWANYLQSENERQTQELEQARQLQLSMLPERVPEHPTVEIAAFMQTATEVGGDYYDFDVADDGTLTIIIGDATGHGLPASTMVTATKGILGVLSGEQDLERVLTAASEALRQMHLPKLYMALALGKLRDHTLELIGAGMPPALVYRAASGCIEQVPLKGMPLGSGFNYPYERRCVVLSPGDTMLLMSDGFPELFGDSGEMLGYDRAVEVFAEVAAGKPEEIVTHLRGRAKAWCNGQGPGDDMTFVVMQVKSAARMAPERPSRLEQPGEIRQERHER